MLDFRDEHLCYLGIIYLTWHHFTLYIGGHLIY